MIGQFTAIVERKGGNGALRPAVNVVSQGAVPPNALDDFEEALSLEADSAADGRLPRS